MTAVQAGVTVDLWNVGQGDASSIRLPSGELILIDVGPKNSTLSQWLCSGRRGRIRDMILTHNDADHVGALTEIVSQLHGDIGRVSMLQDRKRGDRVGSKLFNAVADFSRTGAIKVRRLEVDEENSPRKLWGDATQGLSLMLWHPTFVENETSTSPNDASAVLGLCAGENVLITWPGDAPLRRVADVVPGPTELLFGPHHGAPQDPSRDIINAALDALSPNECFLSLASDNRYNHPNARYIESLCERGCRVSCSQMTLACDRQQVLDGRHIMNSNAYLGLPAPRKGVFCRGHARFLVQDGKLVPDKCHLMHEQRLQALHDRGRRLLCMPRNGGHP